MRYTTVLLLLSLPTVAVSQPVTPAPAGQPHHWQANLANRIYCDKLAAAARAAGYNVQPYWVEPLVVVFPDVPETPLDTVAGGFWVLPAGDTRTGVVLWKSLVNQQGARTAWQGWNGAVMIAAPGGAFLPNFRPCIYGDPKDVKTVRAALGI